MTGAGAAGFPGAAVVLAGKDGATLGTFTGVHGDDGFGVDVAGPGDVDADGFVDVVVGAPQTTTSGGTYAGRVRVFSGFDGTVLHTIDGGTPGEQLGSSVGRFGDFDADGHADFVMGVTKDGTGGVNAGAAYVVSGKTGGILASFFGNTPGDLYGFSCDGVGDVDGDGVTDLAGVAKPLFPNLVHSVRVDSGATGQPIHQFGGVGTPWYAQNVSRMGDLDFDGRADVLVSLFPTGTGPYEVHVMSGATGLTLAKTSGPGEIGWAVSDAGDVNGDGQLDFLASKAGFDWGAYAFSPTCGSITKYGSACPNAGGFLPKITLLEGCATPGGEIRLTTQAGSITNSVAALVVGATPAAVPLPGCTFLVGPPLAVSFLPTLF
ncbi:MAG: FG-GAP-like repeat-containing protein, partial [Planctomycetota bacterium JB042]